MTDDQIASSTLQAEFTGLQSGKTYYFRAGALEKTPVIITITALL